MNISHKRNWMNTPCALHSAHRDQSQVISLICLLSKVCLGGPGENTGWGSSCLCDPWSLGICCTCTCTNMFIVAPNVFDAQVMSNDARLKVIMINRLFRLWLVQLGWVWWRACMAARSPREGWPWNSALKSIRNSRRVLCYNIPPNQCCPRSTRVLFPGSIGRYIAEEHHLEGQPEYLGWGGEQDGLGEAQGERELQEQAQGEWKIGEA